MKSLKEYIVESFQEKKYLFKIKIAGELKEDTDGKLKTMLEKWGVDAFSKAATTPITAMPLDFPNMRNTEVHVFDVILNYPTTQQELREYISQGLQISADIVRVRNPNEPTEEDQARLSDPFLSDKALLSDPNYKEAGKVKSEKYFGTKYNLTLLKELEKASKERNKAQNVKIPTGDEEKSSPVYDEDGKTSPVGSKAKGQ